ncbi:replication protein A 70 kDa DNA-binding subunit E-like [Selaginella moellendorffii]|uniref:replication protein A 70 kDa DNA-binding subunit E-like n=1 Tax=Selaginella moellendorffii TaxID=88036 RepID=UPI000D1CC333|nr:replication protein A 70 kDa DNA-binding subunit E-like [Selaginella moellendorffii]|eukprot:XP_024538368.1 replication protein A 70 kDa DNA-binding subunit E-like [Selaginella moellendorffii]
MKCTDDGIRRVKENSKEELMLRVTNIDSKPGALTKKFSVMDDREILEAIASHRVSSLIDSCGARLNSFVKFLDYAFLETNGKQFSRTARGAPDTAGRAVLCRGVWKHTHSNPILQDMKVGESSKKAVIKEVFIKEISDRSYRWSFHARVTHKNKLIHFNTKRSGCIMSFDVVDVQGTEIRIIGSDDCALVLSDKIVQGTVYSFSGSGGIRHSNQAYTPFEATWEIQANKGMEFTALDEDAMFPRIVLAKTSILSACQKERDSFVDVVGIVIWIGTITVTSRDSGTFVKKRTLCLGDDSGHSVDLCLWDLKAEEEGSYIQERIDSGVQPIICVKGGKVSDYNGKSLSAIGVSTILIELEMEAVADLREWMTLYYNVTNFIHLSTSSSRQIVSCTTTLSEISNM